MIEEILLRVDRPSLFRASQVCSLWRNLSLKQVVPIKSIRQLEDVCSKGDRLSIVKSKPVKEWLDNGLDGACKGGHRDLAVIIVLEEPAKVVIKI